MNFSEWVIFVERSYVDPPTIQQLERAFDDGLDQLIARIQNPILRQTFLNAKSCRVRNANGRCVGFVDYMLAALINHGLYRNYDIEAALAHMVWQMTAEKKNDGTPKSNLFSGFDEERPFIPGTNPLEARFKKSVSNVVNAIASGQIPRLRIMHRPPGTLSIQRTERGEQSHGISPDEIPGKPSIDERELLADIEEILRKRNTPDLDLVGMFRSITAGKGTREQKNLFGDRKTRLGRKLIVQTIRDYANQTQNWQLQRLLDKFKDFDATRPDPPRDSRTAPAAKPKFPPDEQDFRSIVQVVEAGGRRATSSVLGKMRRRWLERKPRNPNSLHANRLHDVLANMVQAGVLSKDGFAFVPGPKYRDYLDADGVRESSVLIGMN